MILLARFLARFLDSIVQCWFPFGKYTSVDLLLKPFDYSTYLSEENVWPEVIFMFGHGGLRCKFSDPISQF